MKQNYITEALHLINLLLKSKIFLFEKTRYDNIFFMNAPLSNLEKYGASLFGVNPNLNESNYTYFDIYKIDNSDEHNKLIKKKFNYDNLSDTFFDKLFDQYSNKGILDLLGKYIRINGVENEGEIIIYHNAILIYSELLGKQHFPRKSQVEVYEAIFKIVLWHEMGRISHWLQDKNNNRWNNDNYSYENQNDYDLHEGLAQAFTYWAILFYDENEYPLLNTIFTLMTLSQPSQYKTYHKIISKTNDFYKFLDAISEIRKLDYPPKLEDLLKNL